MTAIKNEVLILGGIAAAAVLYVAMKGVKGAAHDLAVGVVGIGGDVVAGGAEGIGEVLGIPQTNDDQCSIDLANGNTLAASFSCPASRFLKSTLGF